jgi:hypothetical protein
VEDMAKNIPIFVDELFFETKVTDLEWLED